MTNTISLSHLRYLSGQNDSGDFEHTGLIPPCLKCDAVVYECVKEQDICGNGQDTGNCHTLDMRNLADLFNTVALDLRRPDAAVK